MVQFMVVGAKPTVVITTPLYASGQNLRNKTTEKWKLTNASDPENGASERTGDGTLSNYEQWMPRYDPKCTETELTSTSDNDMSDGTPHSDRTNKRSSFKADQSDKETAGR
jgi:hypothetical protein